MVMLINIQVKTITFLDGWINTIPQTWFIIWNTEHHTVLYTKTNTAIKVFLVSCKIYCKSGMESEMNLTWTA
jgi:hypothetical protein